MGNSKCTGFAQQIMIEKEVIIDYMKTVWKWERKLDQTTSNSSPYESLLNPSIGKSLEALLSCGSSIM